MIELWCRFEVIILVIELCLFLERFKVVEVLGGVVVMGVGVRVLSVFNNFLIVN